MKEGYSVISFPSLGIELNPPRYFSIGSLNIYYYGVIIALGLLLAVLYGLKRRKQFGLKEDDILDGVLWIVPFAVLCARAYYCAFKWEEMFASNPISVLYVWEGGIAIYGGIIGAAIGVVIHCLVKKISLPAVLDIVALGFLIGQCIGRWGNFINREAFGVETESFLRMGLMSTISGNVTYHHPTFLYESLWNLVGFAALHFLSKKRRYDGQIALSYVAWYGLGRTFIEGLRTDSLYIGTMRVSQLVAAITCFAAVAVLLWQAFVPHDRQKLFVNVVAQREAEAAAAAETEPAAEEAAEEEPAEAPEETN
ncbi:MAG: prolipoprotein diacylglyceryl transferase [Oscillospiraceae bacterium]|nr:prolipoprotein diacylglyceryl transferase [Oscillospiraceae bacterium]